MNYPAVHYPALDIRARIGEPGRFDIVHDNIREDGEPDGGRTLNGFTREQLTIVLLDPSQFRMGIMGFVAVGCGHCGAERLDLSGPEISKFIESAGVDIVLPTKPEFRTQEPFLENDIIDLYRALKQTDTPYDLLGGSITLTS